MRLEPNYQYFVEAVRNKKPARMPIYDHHIDAPFIEKATHQELVALLDGSTTADKKKFFERYVGYWEQCSYDIVTFERGIPLSFPGQRFAARP